MITNYALRITHSYKVKAYAKINIGLDVTGKREDGYHLLKTCMQTIDIFDDVTVSAAARTQTGDIRITSDSPLVPKDKTNIAYKAARIVKEQFGIHDKLAIDIRKRIPVSAGLAGGSTDAAAVIKAMDSLYGLEMSLKQMDEIALKLGADVPFCLRRGLWLCEGIGEILSPLGEIPGVMAVIVKPDFAVSTKWCYEEYDKIKNVSHPDMDALTAAVKAKNIPGICAGIGNVLEAATFPAYPEAEKLKEALLLNGAMCACMSGSGGACFGLFDNKKAARGALEFFLSYPGAESAVAADFVN